MTDQPATTPVEQVAVNPETSWRHGPSHLRLWVTAIGILALDLFSKSWAFRALHPHEAWTFIPNLVEFRRSLNDGAVFGAFTGFVSLFIFASVGALLFVLYLFAQSPRSHRSLHIALGLILSGALGNLYDRIKMQADVVKPVDAADSRHGLIGKLTKQTDQSITIEDWPEGGNPQRFSRADVTLKRQGVVRDFIKFTPRFPEWVPRVGGRDVWPWVFNVADMALVCGVILLLLHSWLDHRTHGNPDGVASEPTTESPTGS